MLGTSLTLLSPAGLLVVLPALAAVAATWAGLNRATAVRRILQLPDPGAGPLRVRLGLVALAGALLTLAAAQPALTRVEAQHTRRDAQLLFVFDVSRSMAAAAGPRAPTRLDRAVAAAHRLRSSLPTVPAGVATLTDRVLPSLLPVPGVQGFDVVVDRGLRIEEPPPQVRAVRATSLDALAQIPGAGFFDPKARTRIVVVLTDGESTPVETGDLAAAFAGAPGLRLLVVRFWSADERVFDAEGRAEAAYAPDPAGGAVLTGLADALGEQAFDEADLGHAQRALARLAGNRPESASAGSVRTRRPLAPYAAGLALLAALALVATMGIPRTMPP
jgi:hypothetical protein